ncbi:MAG TPA: TPM domain-containing protein [Bacteroidetes bacterium]|nr:TPM domain-containing protein [Bacteroidota bacterium]
MSPTAKRFFTKEEQDRIMNAILNAELDTSGEIRVHIESVFKDDVMDRATFIFKKLKMHRTELRNGVLFYLAVKSRKFAIIGDVGINKEVPKDFWNDIKEKMAEYFKENKFTEGLVFGISETGAHLKKHFPYHLDDINELSDEISFGK